MSLLVLSEIQLFPIIKMNPQVKEKWVNALRSGDYSQNTDGRLRNQNGFCCLGVLCDLYAKENDKEWDDNQYFEYYLFEDHYEFPPESVIEWAGLSCENPEVKIVSGIEHYSTVETLACLNDSAVTFNEIANLISSQL